MKTKKMYAVVKNTANCTEIIERQRYSNKKDFAADLKGNGYTVKFIFTDVDYQKVMKRIADGHYMELTQKEDIIYQYING